MNCKTNQLTSTKALKSDYFQSFKRYAESFGALSLSMPSLLMPNDCDCPSDFLKRAVYTLPYNDVHLNLDDIQYNISIRPKVSPFLADDMASCFCTSQYFNNSQQVAGADLSLQGYDGKGNMIVTASMSIYKVTDFMLSRLELTLGAYLNILEVDPSRVNLITGGMSSSTEKKYNYSFDDPYGDDDFSSDHSSIKSICSTYNINHMDDNYSKIESVAIITDVSVHPCYIGKGVGKKAIMKLIQNEESANSLVFFTISDIFKKFTENESMYNDEKKLRLINKLTYGFEKMGFIKHADSDQFAMVGDSRKLTRKKAS